MICTTWHPSRVILQMAMRYSLHPPLASHAHKLFPWARVDNRVPHAPTPTHPRTVAGSPPTRGCLKATLAVWLFSMPYSTLALRASARPLALVRPAPSSKVDSPPCGVVHRRDGMLREGSHQSGRRDVLCCTVPRRAVPRGGFIGTGRGPRCLRAHWCVPAGCRGACPSAPRHALHLQPPTKPLQPPSKSQNTWRAPSPSRKRPQQDHTTTHQTHTTHTHTLSLSLTATRTCT